MNSLTDHIYCIVKKSSDHIDTRICVNNNLSKKNPKAQHIARPDHTEKKEEDGFKTRPSFAFF